MKEKENRGERMNLENAYAQIIELENKYSNILKHHVCQHLRNSVKYILRKIYLFVYFIFILNLKLKKKSRNNLI